METDLVSLLFNSVTASIQSFISNDISVMLLGMVSLTFIIFAYFKIREFLNIGMTDSEIAAKNSFSRWQESRGTWRESLMREEFQSDLEEVRKERHHYGHVKASGYKL